MVGGILTRRLSIHRDLRLLVMVALATVAAPHLRIDTARVGGLLATGLVLLFLGRMIVIGMNWINAHKVYALILSSIERLPHGARVAVTCGGDSFPCLANMAVITKDACLNTLFAEPGKQVLRVVYGSKTPFSVDPSQDFRMEPEEKGRADPFPRHPAGALLLCHADQPGLCQSRLAGPLFAGV